MSKIKGMAKITAAYARVQQKKDWQSVKEVIPNAIDPDWDRLSIKKADKYMAKICLENNIDFFNQIVGK